MKRMFVLAALLAAASACAPAGQGNNSNLAANNANRATPAASPVAAVTDAEIIAADRQIWEALKAKNWDGFAALLADDAVSVFGDGVADKARTVEGVKQLDLTDYALADTKVLKLDADAALITYTSTSKGSYDGQPLPDAPSRDTTLFVRRGGKWLAAFHQETPAVQADETASPAANSNAAANTNSAASASPAAAASPAPAPASVTEAEKQIWDALKRKDWDAFAAFLAEDQLEVEPGGVHTKARSVEAVKGFDFSTAALSDFKETKLSPNATLLTYLVKGRGRDWPPGGFRSSTVWVNRGGKWLAVFHQATAVTR